MNPEFLDRSVQPDSSFSITHANEKHLMKLFHYHQQVEIVAIVRSTGTRFIGDAISDFKPGEIVVIGENLPHMWQNDRSYFEDTNDKRAEAITIHLGNNFVKKGLLDIPEHVSIKRLIKRSKRGILFKNHADIFSKLLKLPQSTGYAQFLGVLDIINGLSNSKIFEPISSDGFMERISNEKESRIYPVHNYIMKNFKEDISLGKVAEVANMNPSAFSRYFKKNQGITLVQYINNIRVGYACKLLMKKEMSVIEICYASGFSNVSNFNRHFRKKYQMAPREYRLKIGD